MITYLGDPFIVELFLVTLLVWTFLTIWSATWLYVIALVFVRFLWVSVVRFIFSLVSVGVTWCGFTFTLFEHSGLVFAWVSFPWIFLTHVIWLRVSPWVCWVTTAWVSGISQRLSSVLSISSSGSSVTVISVIIRLGLDLVC